MDKLALHGGPPIRDRLLPYGRQSIDDSDIDAVVSALRSDWLTTGPKVPEFEAAFAGITQASEAVAVSNGTAALHAAMASLEIGPGDEVIVPAMTFAATANAVVYQGGTPIFADVLPETLLIDPESVEALISPRTKAILAVDYAGQPCDYQALRVLAERHGLRLAADACHSLGGAFQGRPVGTLADVSAFSFHPVKPLTTGEGGMVTTDDPALARRLRTFRNHGITSDHRAREQAGSWYYEMVELGFNYRLTDLQCALGVSQLKKLPEWLQRRQAIAMLYDRAFGAIEGLQPLRSLPEVAHAYHLYVIRLDLERLKADRATIFAALRAEGVGVNVHYVPVHMHPFYRDQFGTRRGQCPNAEQAYEEVLSLPIFPLMGDEDAEDVVRAIKKVLRVYLA